MSRQTHQEGARTLDRGPPDANRAPVYTIGQIGPKRKLRPDGTLLCEDVPIARTGTLLYRTDDGIPVRPPTRPGASQVLHITRDRMSLFAPQTLGSAVGAAVTNDHPPVDVDPLNWTSLAKGFVLDAWQGQGADADVMFADIVVSDKGLIHKINTNELREVSLGYDAAYEDLGDGNGKQRNIIINHLALVERGRCGPRFAIGDRETVNTDEKEITMPRPIEGNGGARPRNRLENVRAALEELEQAEPEEGVHVHVHMPTAANGAPTRDAGTVMDEPVIDEDTEQRLASIEDGLLEMRGMMQTLLKQRTTDGATLETPPAGEGDSTTLQTPFQQMIAQAEILVPGFRVPTFDSALPRARTMDSMTAVRRSVLTQLANTTEGAALLGQVSDEGFDVAQADPASVTTVFKAAAALKASMNNRSSTHDRLTVPGGGAAVILIGGGGMKALTGDEINKQNEEFWKRQEGRA